MLTLPQEVKEYFDKDRRLPKVLDDLEKYYTDNVRFPHHCWDEHYSRVMRIASVFGREEGLGEKQMLLLLASALIHDIGYHLPHRDEFHPEISSKWVKENLGSYGYSEDEVKCISDAVLYHDLRFGEPVDDIGRILHDADSFEKASVGGRIFGVAVDPRHPIRREIAHKMVTTPDYARGYLKRMKPLPDGTYFYTETGNRYNSGRIELIKKVFETYLDEYDGKLPLP